MASEYGLKPLASPANENAGIDIVFVHGLFGHREKTWTGPKTHTLWPRDLLPTDVPNARIMTFGYDADVVKLDSNQVTNGTMESHAVDLCHELAGLRADTATVSFRRIRVEQEQSRLMTSRSSVRSSSLRTA